MSTYTQICYHIVFATKGRSPVLIKDQREPLFRYIWGILKNKNCQLHRINGVEDHLHLLIELHPTIALADLVKEIKASSSAWIKAQRIFPAFEGWQEGYGAFTKSNAEKEGVIHYIKRQEEHHRNVSSAEELRKLLEEAGVTFDERYFA